MKRRTLPVAQPQALEHFLARSLSLGVDEARRLVAQGSVYVQGRRCMEPERRLAVGQKVSVVLEESGRSALVPDTGTSSAAVRVLYEDVHLIAVDKPAGVHAQPSVGRVGGSLVDLVSQRLGHAAGLVHRLDRFTSGVTVFGKTPAATAGLAEHFRSGRARKTYLAIAGPGLPERGTVELPIAKDPSHPSRYRAGRHLQGRSAVTHFECLYRDETLSVVRLFPQTGRTHQLRVHLAALGAPIVGDALYGGAAAVAGHSAPRFLLHALQLELPHPESGTPLVVRAPLPDDFRPLWTRAGLSLEDSGPAH